MPSFDRHPLTALGTHDAKPGQRLSDAAVELRESARSVTAR